MNIYNVSLIFLASFFAITAQAAPVTCHTNPKNDPKFATTYVTIDSVDGDVQATVTTLGGLAHFVTFPKTFAVSVQHFGPEIVTYSNVEQGFELNVGFQPIGGQIRGTLTET